MTVTRRRMMTMAAGAVAAVILAVGALAATGRFADVTDAHPVDAIEWAADAGITAGCDTDRFCPDQPLKRKHARVFIERFYDQVLAAGGDDQFANPDFTRADMMALLHTMAAPSTTTTTSTATTTTTAPTAAASSAGSLGVRIAPEDCAGYSRSFYEPHGTSWRALGGVGYLTGRQLTSGDVDHVVSLEEAWCSGIRSTKFGSAPANHRASVSSVNRGKGGRDPLEWWNTSGTTSPRQVSYPGWCDYLTLHVQIKQTWAGTMDKAEHDFIRTQLANCSNQTPAAATNLILSSTSPQPAQIGGAFTLTATLKDQDGQPIAGVRIHLASDNQDSELYPGQERTTNRNGTATKRYTWRSRTPGAETITATYEGATATMTVEWVTDATAPTTTTTTTTPQSGCTHWHAGHPKHTHPGTNHDGTHRSGKCAGY